MKKEIKGIKKKVLVGILAVLFVCVSFYSGVFVGRGEIRVSSSSLKLVNQNANQPSNVDFSLFWEAWNKFLNKSSKNPQIDKMMEGAISGVLSSVNDPYTTYFTKEENDRFKQDIHGEFGGIGIEIVLKDGYPVVVAPLSGYPAEQAGIKAKDIIVEIDGTNVKDITFDQAIDRIRGEENTPVNLKVTRDGNDQPITFTVSRKKISLSSVTWKLNEVSGKKIYNLKISQFGDDTEGLFEKFVDEAVKTKPDGIILDLRNNPGGYLETAVDISSYFLDGGVVVSERGTGGNTKDYKTTKNGRLKNFKTVTIVNGGSASASEILSGALQDHKASKIIGEKTFGKGSVQELVPLSDGSAIKVTVADWLTPSGRTINGSGIEPDIKVSDDDKTPNDEIVDVATKLLTE